MGNEQTFRFLDCWIPIFIEINCWTFQWDDGDIGDDGDGGVLKNMDEPVGF